MRHDTETSETVPHDLAVGLLEQMLGIQMSDKASKSMAGATGGEGAGAGDRGGARDQRLSRAMGPASASGDRLTGGATSSR